MKSFKPQFSLLPKRDYQSFPLRLHALQRQPRVRAQLPVLLRTNIRQLMLLPVRPQVFDRIQFGRVGRQEFGDQTALARFHIAANRRTTVGRQPVPDNQQRLANLPPQRLQELNHLRRFDRAGI